MFKVFGLGDEKQTVNINEDINDNQELEKEVGQVALDVLENPREFIIIAPIAGVELSDIDLSLNKNVLSISGTRNKSKEYFIDGTNLRNEECFWGKFVRNIILPETLSLDKIKAYIENGILTVVVPRSHFSSQTIKIDKIESYS